MARTAACHHRRHCTASASFFWHQCGILAERAKSLCDPAGGAESGEVHSCIAQTEEIRTSSCLAK
jgi:hypothetical protein